MQKHYKGVKKIAKNPLCETCIHGEHAKIEPRYYQFKYRCNDGYHRGYHDGRNACMWYIHKDPEVNRQLQLKTLCFTCQRVKLPNHDMSKFECDFPYECRHNGFKRCKGYVKTENGEINPKVVKRLSWGGCY